MSDYRESSNAAKAIRQGIVEARPVGGKKRQGKKSVVVETRWPGCFIKAWHDWHSFGRYPNEQVAQGVVDQMSRKHTRAEYRIKP